MTATVKIGLGIYSSGFFMKKNQESKPVFRLASVIPPLGRERGSGATGGWFWSATVLEAAAKEQDSLRGLWL